MPDDISTGDYVWAWINSLEHYGYGKVLFLHEECKSGYALTIYDEVSMSARVVLLKDCNKHPPKSAQNKLKKAMRQRSKLMRG